VESWRAAFWLPNSSSEAEGIASLQAEAARLGANGLINVVCIDQGHFIWSWSRTPSILCYGHAIRWSRCRFCGDHSARVGRSRHSEATAVIEFTLK
jgi:hypothetical protein